MRRNQPLTPRQVEVLQWIAKGCPAGVWQDFTYKTTAYALAVRGLVTVDRRRNKWSAQLTDDGRFYILNGSYPSDTIPNGGAGSSLNRPKVTDLAAELLVQLTSAGSQLTVPSPTDRQRAMYRRAIHRLITGHHLPEGFVLRHTGRDHGDLTIRLQHDDEGPRRPPSPKVTVPQSSVAITDAVRDLVSGIRLPVTEPTMERALRILQAVANECAVRGWSMNRDPEDDGWLKIISSDGAFQLSLREQLVDCDVPDEATLSASKYSWQRIPLQARKVGSGRLTLQLGKYYRTRSWSDRSRWSLEDKLGALFAELDAKVAEAVEDRRRREADLLGCRGMPKQPLRRLARRFRHRQHEDYSSRSCSTQQQSSHALWACRCDRRGWSLLRRRVAPLVRDRRARRIVRWRCSALRRGRPRNDRGRLRTDHV
ncbi:hypothetical protein QXK92_11725 [Mycobacterium sp. TY815]|nr:hypothetical protein [Mycobacterium sp. TY815]MDP7703354.1 hypothetical protein [Mycobacterium sp. TY815]